MVDYNNFAKTFSDSRKNMKWEEILYFLESVWDLEWKKILDVWCGNWRFLWELKMKYLVNKNNYLWIDLSLWLLEEARKIYKDFEFRELDMLDLGKIPSYHWGAIYFIASFHHLFSINNRIKVLKDAYNLLEKWWMVFMTNWALNSRLNFEKYKNSIIFWSENKYWSIDYNIKIWEFTRFYHCFNLSELEYLFKESWFEIIENRLFENDRNYISIIKKNVIKKTEDIF